MDAVLSDIGTDAVKIGMLFSADLIKVVAAQLKKYGVENIVLDPVMVAQSGDKLLQDDAVEAIKKYLMPLSTVVTPNLPEAAVMLDRKIGDMDAMEAAARDLSKFGGKCMLIKGGHLEDQPSRDLLYLVAEDRFIVLQGDYIRTRNNHGTGCTLSSAIAAYLAGGLELEAAIRASKTYISDAIRKGAGYRLGKGHGPVHHFFSFWE
jgi:hydroxymethylpyrimidine/phosphomethylpyrimidine kinase